MNKLNLTSFPNLQTRHFILRRLNVNDESEIFILRSDDKVLKYLDIPRAATIDAARQFIHKTNEGISNGEWVYWAIAKNKTSKLIGTICLWNFSMGFSKADIGFALLPDYFGKGVMQEAIPAIIKYGFKRLNLQLIEGEVDPNNLKSIKLMEKYGFTCSRQSKNTSFYSLKP